MIIDIGFENSLGDPVARRVNEAFKQVDVTPQLAKEEIDRLRIEITTLDTAATNIISAFENLSIGAEDLEPGACELGFMVPKEAIDFRLDRFAQECRDFDFIFGTFSEVVTGRKHHYRISTISSSDLSVFLDSGPAVAAAIAIAGERILALYKQMLEIKKLRSEMLKNGVKKENLEAIDKQQNTRMGEEIAELASQIIEKHRGIHDSGRANELENSLRIALNKLANRFDRGFHIEVRIGELPASEEGDEMDEDLEAQADAIHKASKPLQFIRVGGDPILTLPEANDAPKPRKPKPQIKRAIKKKGTRNREGEG